MNADGLDCLRKPEYKAPKRLNPSVCRHNLVREDSQIAVSRYIETDGRALYHAADEKELEGVVAKRKESLYFMGRRTNDWVKFKRMADEEFIVGGYIKKGLHTFSLYGM